MVPGAPRVRFGIAADPAAPVGAHHVRVAMVGTFDLENLGDLLFPYVAHHELAARIPGVELELFSYRAVDPPAWPLKVRPVRSLAERLGEFDLLVVGGGHIVRGDDLVAPGYEPTDAATSHPYGMWLTPTLLAAAAGVPVVWNAVGAIDSVPDALGPLVDAALGGVDYLAVRDLPSARFVREHCATASPTVVPDTVFGIAAVLDDASRAAATARLAELGVEGGYVVVQPSRILEGNHHAVGAVAAAAAAHGLAVVEVPVGPIHHDSDGRLSLSTPTVSLGEWPEPLVTTALLAGAEAVIASSLHAGIVATTHGVPLYRPRAERDSKHEALDLLPGVTGLPADGADEEVATAFGRTAPSSQVVSHLAALQHHWDEVARRATGRGTRGPRASVVDLVESMPASIFERDRAERATLARLAASHDVERWRDAESRAALDVAIDVERDRSAHLAEVLRRRSVRTALLIADFCGSVRDATSRRTKGP